MEKKELITRKYLAELTGAKPYQIYYLTTIGRLPLEHRASGSGDRNIYYEEAIEILEKWMSGRK